MTSRLRSWSLKRLAEQKLSPETAQIILEDVASRLESQILLLDQLGLFLEGSHVTTETGKRSHDGGVIFAGNGLSSRNLLDWKGHAEREKQQEKIKRQAKKMIRNLQVLHKDTHKLVSGLSASKTWHSFDPAQQFMLASSLEQVRSRHGSTLESIADLVIPLRSIEMELPGDMLTQLLRGRLPVQLMCDHYVSLSKGRSNGGVSMDCNLEPVVEEAVTEAKHMCDAHYQMTPNVVLPAEFPNLTLIRPWVQHSLVEVLKNAMVASLDTSVEDPPPIEIAIEELDDTVVVSVLDQGPGCAATEKAFEFASSSSGTRWDRLEEQQSYAMVRSPLQSLGVGLPSSRWMMMHFGGDLTLQNRPPGGCEAKIILNSDIEAEEWLNA